MTYFADHCEQFSHDLSNRYLRGDKITPRLVWENVQPQVVRTPKGYLVFDDTVADKNYAQQIELVRHQWSGNAKAVIKGIGVVTCVYVNPETDQFWVIDYRIYDPDGDGKTKLDHVEEMLTNIHYQKALPYQAVLMDTWSATKDLMLFIDKLDKLFYCPLRDNRRVDDSQGSKAYQRVDGLTWSEPEVRHGKTLKIHGFPKDYTVRCFRVEVSTHRTDFVVTNDKAQDSTQATRGVRLSVEDRATAPRSQTSNGDGTVPMPHGPHSTQPHRLCFAGVGTTQRTRHRRRDNRLSTQTRLAG